MKTVGEIISLKIKELNISQAELGRRILGLSGQQIGYYIKGKQTPSLDFAVKWYEITMGYVHTSTKNLVDAKKKRFDNPVKLDVEA